MSYRDVLRARLQQFRERNPPPTSGCSRSIAALLAAIHESAFDASISVRAIAAQCRLRDHNVSCRFKYEMDMSIREYIEAFRFTAACALLEDATLSVSIVAHAVGYDNLQTFYRAFHRRFGCTPGVFRDQGGTVAHGQPYGPHPYRRPVAGVAAD